MIVVYDITTATQPVLKTIHEMDGYYSDARLVGNQLHLITNTAINR
ncbi:beta-propeller domain-containing protein [Patescibacteria group bacterium]|nr:beta-propeller domain-containing protein [Patescibacteria group bacterium]